MKKLSLTVTLSALFLISCGEASKPGYTITGTLEGAAEGSMVYLQNRVNRQFEKLDSAAVTNGTFIFKGVQDSAVSRYITYPGEEGKQANTDFFLENGQIVAKLNQAPNLNSVTGTPTNETYQAFKNGMNTLSDKQRVVYESLQDTTLTEEQAKAKHTEMDNLDTEMMTMLKSEMEKNITNVVGITLLTQYNSSLDYPELEVLLAKVPESYRVDPAIERMVKLTETAQTVAIGRPFVDFEMKTPEGTPMKLSDHIGKNKVVLVDFWASWCGPCRRAMPHLSGLYKQYKSKGFEIVGVSLDNSEDAWKKGIEQLGLTWPQMSDVQYWNCEGAKLYAVRSIPHIVLIDKAGTIIAKNLSEEELSAKLAEMLK